MMMQSMTKQTPKKSYTPFLPHEDNMLDPPAIISLVTIDLAHKRGNSPRTKKLFIHTCLTHREAHLSIYLSILVM